MDAARRKVNRLRRLCAIDGGLSRQLELGGFVGRFCRQHELGSFVRQLCRAWVRDNGKAAGECALVSGEECNLTLVVSGKSLGACRDKFVIYLLELMLFWIEVIFGDADHVASGHQANSRACGSSPCISS